MPLIALYSENHDFFVSSRKLLILRYKLVTKPIFQPFSYGKIAVFVETYMILLLLTSYLPTINSLLPHYGSNHPLPLRTPATRKLYALPTPHPVLYYYPVMEHHHHNIPYHPTTARRDNPQYEYATAVTPAPQSTRPDADTLPPPPESTPVHEAVQMLRVVMSLIASACNSPLDAYYCVLRASGLSMEAIGRLDHNKSRIAVHKRLHKICRREPVLLDYLCNDRKGGKDA